MHHTLGVLISAEYGGKKVFFVACTDGGGARAALALHEPPAVLEGGQGCDEEVPSSADRVTIVWLQEPEGPQAGQDGHQVGQDDGQHGHKVGQDGHQAGQDDGLPVSVRLGHKACGPSIEEKSGAGPPMRVRPGYRAVAPVYAILNKNLLKSEKIY